jgi:hypothetical protein
MKSTLQELYETATDAELLMSRRNVHVLGLDSYVLRNVDGRLTRVYAARSSALQANYPYSESPSLGVHDHLYDFTMHGIQGKVINYTYRVDPFAPADRHTVDHYAFASIVKNVDTACTIPFHRIGTANLMLQAAHLLEPGDYEVMRAHELHTVWAEAGSGWLIRERSYVDGKNSTNLYSYGTPVLGMDYYNQWDDLRQIRTSFEEFFL